MSVTLDASLIESFAGIFLSPMYDDPQPTPACHREWWELYCLPNPTISLAAPRGHAKSTALTHDFVLANVCFRVESHVLLVSATEELSFGHLGDIAKELRDNDELREAFGIIKFLTDSKGEIVVLCTENYQFRIIARGAGQKLRGLKWNGRRPGLIVCDDMEEDEQVESIDRRRKFRDWFLRALMPLGRRNARIRWHGTILHEDAFLARTMKDSEWTSRLYKAHAGFDDFAEILWPEMWSEERLRAVQRKYINQGDPGGYSQEYLNDPLDNSEAYIRKEDMLPMLEEHHLMPMKKVVGADFAVSKADRANRTSFTIGGVTTTGEGSLINIIDQRVGRWDTQEWMQVMFDIEDEHHPDVFFVEDGVIWKAISPTLYREMRLRNKWLNCLALPSVKDKATRGRAYQKRSRAHGIRYDKEATWYPAYENEVLRFTGNSDAAQDDQFDSTTILVRGVEQLGEIEEEDFEDEEELELHRQDPRASMGRSKVTGY